jgi:hypothetical protein
VTHRTENVPSEPGPEPGREPERASSAQPDARRPGRPAHAADEPDSDVTGAADAAGGIGSARGGIAAEPVGKRGVRTEVRDAITVRSFLLVLGVLLLQLGFIASYLGAFHDPKPRDIPIAVVAPTGAPAGPADQAVARLNQLPGHPVKARAASDAAAARSLLNDRTVYGILLLGSGTSDRLQIASAAGAAVSTALVGIVGGIDQSQGRTLVATDVIPAGRGDARGLSAFYLVVGWMVGGYLVAAILGIAKGSRPTSLTRGLLRLATLALYAIVSGLGGALIAETILSALSGHFLALWWLGALLVFAVGAFTMALQVLFDIVGIGLAILIFVVLGNPSAGGAYPAVLLPPFWSAIGPWLPPGAGTEAVRTIVYFPAASVSRPLWTLAAYALVGVVVTVLVAAMRRMLRPEPPPARHAAEEPDLAA